MHAFINTDLYILYINNGRQYYIDAHQPRSQYYSYLVSNCLMPYIEDEVNLVSIYLSIVKTSSIIINCLVPC